MEEKTKNKKVKTHNMRKMWRYYGKHKGLLAVNMIFLVCSGAVGILMPILSANALANLATSNFDKAIYEAKSEAYKEFAKRLLDKAVTSRGSPYAMYKKIDYYDVRKTLAELTERKEDKK